MQSFILRKYIEPILPSLLLLLFMLITFIPLSILQLHLLLPQNMLPLICLFYVTLFWKDYLPLWVIFVVGLLYDALTGNAFGYHSILYIIFYWTVVTQSRFYINKPYSMLLAGFAFSTIIVIVVDYAVEVILLHRDIPWRALILEWLVIIGLYTPYHYVLHKIHLMVQRRQKGDYVY